MEDFDDDQTDPILHWVHWFIPIRFLQKLNHGLQSLPPSPKRAERKVRRRPFREAGSGHKQWNTVSCVDTFSIISKFSVQNSKIQECYASGNCSSYP